MDEFTTSLRTPSGHPVLIRPAKGKDAEKIVDLINNVGAEMQYIVIETFSHTAEWEQNYIDNLDLKNIVYLVAIVKRTLVGIISIERESYPKTRHTGTLGMIVKNGYRREGIGSALIEMVLLWAKSRRIEKVCLQCFSTNVPAIELYKKYGFHEECRRRGQFKIDGVYIDEVGMAKWI